MDVHRMSFDISKNDGVCLRKYCLNVPLGLEDKLDGRIGTCDTLGNKIGNVVGILCAPCRSAKERQAGNSSFLPDGSDQ